MIYKCKHVIFMGRILRIIEGRMLRYHSDRSSLVSFGLWLSRKSRGHTDLRGWLGIFSLECALIPASHPL